MDEQTLKTEENKEQKFFDKYGWLIAVACGILSILFLLGTVVKLKLKVPVEGGDPIKVIKDIHLWDYFKENYTYNWTMVVTLVLLVLGTICAGLKKLKNGFGSAAAMFFILAVPMIALAREFFASNTIANLSSVSFGWGSACSLAFVIMATVVSLSTEFTTNPIVTPEIAEDGILIASAFILNLIKIPKDKISQAKDTITVKVYAR